MKLIPNPHPIMSPAEEVNQFEERLEYVLSMHKGDCRYWDWASYAASLIPVEPKRLNTNRLEALQQMAISAAMLVPPKLDQISVAEKKDETKYQEAYKSYSDWHGEFQQTKQLAVRILQGDLPAYEEVLHLFCPFSVIEDVGSSVEFIFHSPKIAECQLVVHGVEVIPDHEKKLSKRGKLSAKKMPRARFHEIYQDYVCGCMLRIVREVFAVLPFKHILITASVEDEGMMEPVPVMSAILPKLIITEVDIDNVDPSDCIESYVHRGDFKATRRSEAFKSIVPLTVVDVPCESENELSLGELESSMDRMLQEFSNRKLGWGCNREEIQ